jgi:uncharacterized protein YjbJ (UPF0337 family)
MGFILGTWRQIKGRLKMEWGNLTGNDLTAIEGARDQLAGLLQQKYGYSKEEAETACGEFPFGMVTVPKSVERSGCLHG